MTCCTLLSNSTIYDTKKPKVSNKKDINICGFFMYVFSCFSTLYKEAFKTVCPIIKTLLSKLIRGETHVRPTHMYFHHTHPKTKTLIGLSIYLSSNRLVESNVHYKLV